MIRTKKSKHDNDTVGIPIIDTNIFMKVVAKKHFKKK
jgi:hypothetical protein